MQLRRFFLSSAVALIPYSPETAERFADLRVATRLKAPDALHLAFAASVSADFFVTTDTEPGAGAPHLAPEMWVRRVLACDKLLSRPMATNPIPDVSPEEHPFTREETLALFDSMRGILKPTFEALGGSEKFFREERESWDKDSEHR